MILKKYINIKSIFIIIFKIKLLFVVGIGDVDIGVVDCVVVVCSLLDPVVVDSKVVVVDVVVVLSCMHPFIVKMILVSVSSITRLIVLPPLPIIRPIRLLCARIFSETSL